MFNTTNDMKNEAVRLTTFVNWPVTFLTPEQMATNGFYYLGRADEVRCAFCKVEIMHWQEGDDPAKDHQKWAPHCPLIRNAHKQNELQVELKGPKHPKYASEAARLKTFEGWPRSMKQRPDELAEAGFYYTSRGDKTLCFYCNGGLKDWENDDIPWEQHARWFSNCGYLLLVKGRDYVQNVVNKACVIKDDRIGEAEHVEQPLVCEQQIIESNICKVCYDAEKIVCFVPCGHVVACAKCAASVSRCPTCRGKIQNAVRMYQV
ncbi:IAP-3 [Epiphyas postvittana nucleopolyhedrovirus]|uniref:Apoptosis 3 protein inhibitor n=1 Tax=Epiphyas postvittana nucleopolyhedrovirus TaxID=70600 RepID=Q9QES9_NPVEP|nr:IAP-3 [Epiphyas postvittana nucleopolyhedrovirus]AAD53953.1 apoptosis 3 protein inhibitor [Epiphyas postvittana nucleopolyhedrovirus]AAK85590.1 IAP-3 [Epiphyas postvittana nucleopolyhedrovirus]